MSTLNETITHMLRAALDEQQSAEMEFERAKARALTARGMVLALEGVLRVVEQWADDAPAAKTEGA